MRYWEDERDEKGMGKKAVGRGHLVQRLSLPPRDEAGCLLRSGGTACGRPSLYPPGAERPRRSVPPDVAEGGEVLAARRSGAGQSLK